MGVRVMVAVGDGVGRGVWLGEGEGDGVSEAAGRAVVELGIMVSTCVGSVFTWLQPKRMQTRSIPKSDRTCLGTSDIFLTSARGFGVGMMVVGNYINDTSNERLPGLNEKDLPDTQ